jgi:glycosyltransferase involved in cell wall biosynthesis
MLRIAYDHHIFSEQQYGGVSRYFFEIAKRIRLLDGYDVSVLSPLFVNNYLAGDPEMKVWGLHMNRLPPPRRVVQMLNGALVGWKLHRDPPDVVHETYHLKQRLASAKSKIVVTLHDMIHEKFPHFFPADDKTRLFKKAALERADHVICISDNTRKDLIEVLGMERERISVIHHSHSLHPRNGGSAHRFIDRPYIAYVGERSGYKNFSGLLHAFRVSEFLAKNFSIVCFGGGPLHAADRAAISSAGLRADQVVHTSGGDEILEGVYSGAAAFVYPSLYEGFGLPPLEAMAASCPVVTSWTSSMPEVCGDAAEYFDPGRPESIAASIERAVASNSHREELIALGLSQIRKFSWNDCAKQTAAVYNAVSNRKVH